MRMSTAQTVLVRETHPARCASNLNASVKKTFSLQRSLVGRLEAAESSGTRFKPSITWCAFSFPLLFAHTRSGLIIIRRRKSIEDGTVSGLGGDGDDVIVVKEEKCVHYCHQQLAENRSPHPTLLLVLSDSRAVGTSRSISGQTNS